MSKYAKINSDNIVENIINCEESEIFAQAGEYVKVTESSRDAHIGSSYNAEKNKFIDPNPYPSWTLDQDTCDWASPAGIKPTDGNYRWDEQSLVWIKLIPASE
jgi:hypothetical protein